MVVCMCRTYPSQRLSNVISSSGNSGILALIVCMRSGPQRALVRVYLPTLLLLPTYFHWTFTLHLGFSETAIIPIAAVFIARSWNNWRWSLTDFLVLGLVAIMIVSQYVNSGYSMAQNLAIHGICNVILPYVLAKGMLHDEQLRVDFVKTVVILLAFIAITSIYEFRMTPDPYKILPAFFFPGQFDAFAQRRYNLTRIAGPFPHAILCGMMLAGPIGSLDGLNGPEVGRKGSLPSDQQGQVLSARDFRRMSYDNFARAVARSDCCHRCSMAMHVARQTGLSN